MKPFLRSNAEVVALLALVAFISLFMDRMNPYIFQILMYVGMNMILAVSLNLILGITGQFSLGHAGFMAVGAYVSASLTYFVGKQMLGISSVEAMQLFFFLALIAGGVASAFLGFLVGLPSLRLRGDYLAIVTLGFGEIIGVLIRNIDAVGGSRGFADIPKLTTFTWVWMWVVVTIVVLIRLIRSSHGRAFLAIREDEVAAQAAGISTTRYKVLAFVVGAFFAGIAGGLSAHFLSYINPSSYTFIRAFEVVTMVVLGGRGSVSGALIAAMIITVLPEALRPLKDYTNLDFRMVIYALLLVVMMLTRPQGLLGKKELWPIARSSK